MERLVERTSSMVVERGFYLLRYLSPDLPSAPGAFVRASPGSEDDVTLVFEPGSGPQTAGRPGSVVVLHVERSASVQLTLQANIRGGSLDAVLQLEPLRGHPAPGHGVRVAVEPVRVEGVGALHVVAHVARRGDVTALCGAWVCGPAAPAPIEGLQCLGQLPRGVLLDCQVAISGEPGWRSWLAGSEFSGTRGRSLFLTGVRLRLSGPMAASHKLAGEALFLGSPVIRKAGQEVEFRSMAGLDPMVGLRFEITAGEQSMAEPPVTSLHLAPAPTHSRSRVRVFRASDARRSA